MHDVPFGIGNNTCGKPAIDGPKADPTIPVPTPVQEYAGSMHGMDAQPEPPFLSIKHRLNSRAHDLRAEARRLDYLARTLPEEMHPDAERAFLGLLDRAWR